MSEKQLVNNYMVKRFQHKNFAGYHYIKLMLEYLLHKYYENGYLSPVKLTQMHKLVCPNMPYESFHKSIRYFLKTEHIDIFPGDFLIQTVENIIEETQNIEILKEEDEF